MSIKKFSIRDQIQTISLSPGQDIIAIGLKSHVQLHKINATSGFSESIGDFSISLNNKLGNFTITDVAWCKADPSLFAASGTNGKAYIFPIIFKTETYNFCMA